MFNFLYYFFRQPEKQISSNKRIDDLENSFEKCVFSFVERENDFIEIFSKYIDKEILKSIIIEIKRPLEFWELKTAKQDIDCCFYRRIYNSSFDDYNTVDYLAVLEEMNVFLSKFGFSISFAKRKDNYIVYYNNKFNEIFTEKLKND